MCFCTFEHGEAIDHMALCSLIHMQKDFHRNIKHVEIHGLSDIDIELHLGTSNNDGEYYAHSIR
jgi:hypothetical protein